MSFITQDDYDLVIDSEELLRICKGDLSKLRSFENSVMDDIAGDLSKLYKVEETLAKTGDNRDKSLLKLMLRIIIYDTCSSLTPEQMTDVIADNHALAEAKLKRIAIGKTILTKGVLINEPPPGEPPATSEDVYFNSSPKRDNEYF